MKERRRTCLLADPSARWEGASAYRQLGERLGTAIEGLDLTDASLKEIADLYFDVMAAGRPTQDDRQAWELLRRAEPRLLVDFFMYELEERPRRERSGASDVIPPPPLPEIDVSPLLDLPLTREDLGPVPPARRETDALVGLTGLVDSLLGDLSPRLSTLLDEDDD